LEGGTALFQAITIRRQNLSDSSRPIDLGFLAETLLFYSDVQIVADRAIIMQLLRALGPGLLLEFLNQKFLSIAYVRNTVGVITTDGNGPNERHDIGLIQLANEDLADFLEGEIHIAGLPKNAARQLASRLAERMEVKRHEADLLENARLDILDSGYMSRIAKAILVEQAPEYCPPNLLQFSVARDTNGLIIETNIDWNEANRSYHKRVSAQHSTLTNAMILSHMVGLHGDLYFASAAETELATNPLHSALLGLKLESIASKRRWSTSAIEAFSRFVLNDGRALRETINTGKRSFEDLYKLLERASRFKGWIAGKSPDRSLLADYLKEVTADSWVDRLPVKALRWALFTALGFGAEVLGMGGVGVAVATAMGAADTFILDKLLKGWKPNQFIENDLARFLLEDGKV
jgi:hypothetical protein